MSQRMELDDKLNDCLERLAAGEAIEKCVERYPGQREELLPLLEVAAATMRTAASITYRPEAKARGLARLTTEAARRGVPGSRRSYRRGWLPRLPKPLVAGLAAVVMTSGLAAGTTFASADSVPGDPLYWVKTSRESISLMMPKSDMSRAQAHIKLATERGGEIGMLLGRGMYEQAELHERQIRRHLQISASLAGVRLAADPIEMPSRPMGSLLRKDATELVAYLYREGEVLRARMNRYTQSVPPGQRHRVVVLMWRSELNFRTYISVLKNGGAPAWPPFLRMEPPRRGAR